MASVFKLLKEMFEYLNIFNEGTTFMERECTGLPSVDSHEDCVTFFEKAMDHCIQQMGKNKNNWNIIKSITDFLWPTTSTDIMDSTLTITKCKRLIRGITHDYIHNIIPGQSRLIRLSRNYFSEFTLLLLIIAFYLIWKLVPYCMRLYGKLMAEKDLPKPPSDTPTAIGTTKSMKSKIPIQKTLPSLLYRRVTVTK